MRKIIASVLSTAILLGCASASVLADAASTTYTIDSSAKTISNVKPLTTVAAFKSNISGADVKVYNVDGSEMADSAYATDNVYATIDGVKYDINVKYGYAPIRENGSALADGATIYNDKATTLGTTVKELNTGSGFGYIQSYAKIGYNSTNFPANTASQTVSITKKSVNGEPVYEMKNDSNNYAYLRSHYTDSSSTATALRTATYVATPVITTMSFTADSEGTVSLYHNVPGTSYSNNTSTTKMDRGIDSLIYGSDNPYVANAVHFMEDGKIMLGGTYIHYQYTSYRSPIHDTGMTWTPGNKYTVSVVQRVSGQDRYAYVQGVYINGTKVFPFENSANAETRFKYQASGTYAGMYSLTTKDSNHKFKGGISSIMIGTAPKVAGTNMTVDLSDVKVYTASAYNPAMDADITLTSSDNNVIIDNANAEISYKGSLNASDFNVPVKIEGDVLTAVSADGLAAKTYSLTNTYTPAEVSELTQVYGSEGDEATENDGVWAKAFTFTVTPNDDVVNEVKVTAKNSGNETLKEESWTGTLSGGPAVFGIIATTRTENGLDGITFTPSFVIQ